MKKILISMGAIIILTPAISTVVACTNSDDANLSPEIWDLKDQTVKVGSENAIKIPLNITNYVDGVKATAEVSMPNIAKVSILTSQSAQFELSIVGLAVGETNVVISYPGADNISFKVTVTESIPPPSIKAIDDVNLTLANPDRTIRVNVSNPIDGKFVNATSSNDSVVSVQRKANSNDLIVHAKQEGDATITVSYPFPSIPSINVSNQTFRVIVTGTSPQIIPPKTSTTTLKYGSLHTALLAIIKNPVDNGTLQAVSNDESVVQIFSVGSIMNEQGEIPILVNALSTQNPPLGKPHRTTITLTYNYTEKNQSKSTSVTFSVTVEHAQ